MCQDRFETVRSFGARFCGQADICKFIIKFAGCNVDVNYTNAIMRDVLSRGLGDPEIQMDIFGDKKQEMTLEEEVFQFVEAKEAGKRYASRLLDSTSIEAVSSYRKTKQQTPNKGDPELLSYCGKRGHGKQSTARVRRTQCPAYGHRCEHCKREHHFETVRRSREEFHDRGKEYRAHSSCRQPVKAPDHESAVFDALCTLFDHFSEEVDPTMDNVYTVTRHNQCPS